MVRVPGRPSKAGEIAQQLSLEELATLVCGDEVTLLLTGKMAAALTRGVQSLPGEVEQSTHKAF